jgi:putative ABC transport system substrate-binding protein
VEGQNLRIESQFANDKPDLLPGLAAELVRLPVAVIVAGDSLAIRPAKEATKNIPIVMTVSSDPVRDGLIASLAHPGGNVTGLTNMSPDLLGKRLQLLREALPRLSRVAALGPSGISDWRALTAATDALGVKLHRLEVSAPGEFERAFEAATENRNDGLLVLPSPLTNLNGRLLVRLAAEHRLPVMYPLSGYAKGGGLMAYGPSIPDLARRAAVYVDKILKGAKPADLPIEQPTKFELVINLKTAKALGLTIPQSVLLRADEVIE